MMQNSFWFGVNLGTFIFPGFIVNSYTGLAFTCLAVFSFSILTEAARALLLSRARGVHLVPPDENEANDESVVLRRSKESFRRHAIETASYILYITLSYIIMLSIMSYNAAIFISVISGTGLGYLIFRNSYFTRHNQTSVISKRGSDEGSTEPLSPSDPGPSFEDVDELIVGEESVTSSSQLNASVIVHRAPDVET